MSATAHPAGFRVADKPAALSFAQAYSFAPVDPMHRDEACLRTPAGGWARYWDPGSTVAVAEFEAEAPREKEKERERERKKRKGMLVWWWRRRGVDGWWAVEKPAAPPEASLLPVSDKPVTLSFKGGLALAKPAGAKPGPSAAFGDDGDSDGGDAEADAHAAKGLSTARRRTV
jgi:RNA-binding protein 5/10